MHYTFDGKYTAAINKDGFYIEMLAPETFDDDGEPVERTVISKISGSWNDVTQILTEMITNAHPLMDAIIALKKKIDEEWEQHFREDRGIQILRFDNQNPCAPESAAGHRYRATSRTCRPETTGHLGFDVSGHAPSMVSSLPFWSILTQQPDEELRLYGHAQSTPDSFGCLGADAAAQVAVVLVKSSIAEDQFNVQFLAKTGPEADRLMFPILPLFPFRTDRGGVDAIARWCGSHHVSFDATIPAHRVPSERKATAEDFFSTYTGPLNGVRIDKSNHLWVGYEGCESYQIDPALESKVRMATICRHESAPIITVTLGEKDETFTMPPASLLTFIQWCNLHKIEVQTSPAATSPQDASSPDDAKKKDDTKLGLRIDEKGRLLIRKEVNTDGTAHEVPVEKEIQQATSCVFAYLWAPARTPGSKYLNGYLLDKHGSAYDTFLVDESDLRVLSAWCSLHALPLFSHDSTNKEDQPPKTLFLRSGETLNVFSDIEQFTANPNAVKQIFLIQIDSKGEYFIALSRGKDDSLVKMGLERRQVRRLLEWTLRHNITVSLIHTSCSLEKLCCDTEWLKWLDTYSETYEVTRVEFEPIGKDLTHVAFIGHKHASAEKSLLLIECNVDHRDRESIRRKFFNMLEVVDFISLPRPSPNKWQVIVRNKETLSVQDLFGHEKREIDPSHVQMVAFVQDKRAADLYTVHIHIIYPDNPEENEGIDFTVEQNGLHRIIEWCILHNIHTDGTAQNFYSLEPQSTTPV